MNNYPANATSMNNIFFNTTMINTNLLDYAPFNWFWAQYSDYFVNWPVTITVEHDSMPVAGAEVTVVDNNSIVIYTGFTDATGSIPLNLTQYRVYNATIYNPYPVNYSSPYNIIVRYAGEEQWLTVEVNESERISFDFGNATGVTCAHSWPLRRAFIGYDNTMHYNDTLLDYLASRFEFSFQINAYNAAELEARNTDFYSIKYNSLSDNYVPPVSEGFLEEYNWFMEHAAEYGADPEDTYQHFWVDTEVRVEQQNLIIPGWQPDSPKPGATAANRVESRIPVYYNSLIRRATNFNTPEIRAAHRAYNLMTVSEPITGGIYWEGIFFDNAAYYGLNVAIVTTGEYPDGGHVAEHPTHAIINTQEWKDWYWYEGEGLFMKEFREYVATNPPELAGRPLKIVPNVANVPWLGQVAWEEAYVDFHPADILGQEFEFNPTRDQGQTMPATIFEKNSLAQAEGIDLYQPGLSIMDRPPYAGNYTADEALMNTLGLHWVTRTPNVIFLGHQANNVLHVEWSQNLKPIFDVDFGAAVGDPYVLTTGTDSKGYAYTIYARLLSCGLAIVRERGSWNQDIDPATGVTVELPGEYIPIDVDGNAFPATDQWTLRNGQAQVFIALDVTNPPCTPDWECTAWSECQGGVQTRICTDLNQCGTENGKPAESQACTSQSLCPSHDVNGNNIIEPEEMFTAITDWFTGQFSLSSLIELMDYFKRGSCS